MKTTMAILALTLSACGGGEVAEKCLRSRGGNNYWECRETLTLEQAEALDRCVTQFNRCSGTEFDRFREEASLPQSEFGPPCCLGQTALPI